MNQLISQRRPEIKASLRIGNTVWLGAASGLYRLLNGQLQECSAWKGRKIAAIGSSDEGMIVAASSPNGLAIHLLSASGTPTRMLPALSNDEPKSLLAEGGIFAGGKRGIYRLDGETWTKVYGHGHTEVIGLDREDGCIRAFVKKQGPQARPALIVSRDEGASWWIELETSYHDGILATSAGRYVTRWRGLWSPGQAVQHEEDAANVALFEPGRSAWVAGNKLCVRFDSGARLDIRDPRFAEAEQLLLLNGLAVVAGGNGAYQVDLFTGQVIDLFENHATEAHAAKIKKLWALEDGRLLATASYGTFYSDDGGENWSLASADWAVLDAEGLALSPDGAWYLAAQRGLFVSWNNGEHWKQVKLATQPHFAELTAIAFAGDRLLLGSKAGLFVSEPGEPKRLQHVGALGDCTVLGLLVEPGGTVLVGTVDGRLERLTPAHACCASVAVFARGCQPLALHGDAVTVLSSGTLYRVLPGQVERIAVPPQAHRIEAIAPPDGGLLAWNHDAAWRQIDASSEWADVPAWLPHVKSVVIADRTVVTDRSAVVSLG